MNRGGIGVGSASIVLIFAVLCLTIFSLISFIVTQNTKSLVSAEAELVSGYYRADAAVEIILDELLSADFIPTSIQGISINFEEGLSSEINIVNFAYPLYNYESKEIFVRVAIDNNSYEILSWRLIDNAEWVAENEANILLN